MPGPAEGPETGLQYSADDAEDPSYKAKGNEENIFSYVSFSRYVAIKGVAYHNLVGGGSGVHVDIFREVRQLRGLRLRQLETPPAVTSG